MTPSVVTSFSAGTPRELASARGLTKLFGELAAVRDASCTFRTHELHAVCGENGAGKSTLLKLVAGLLVPDAGKVQVGGAALSPHTPREAIARRVAMVLQHFSLVPALSVLENIVLGSEPKGVFGTIDVRRSRERAKSVFDALRITVPFDVPVGTLGVADRQRVEIARALYREAYLLILDEPTAVLTPLESADLYKTLRALVEQGKGVVVVTHKMDEVRRHADIVTVLRRGHVVATEPLARGAGSDATIDRIVMDIMGARAMDKTPSPSVAAPRGEEGTHALRLENVSAGGVLQGLTLSIRAGEIVGVAGVEGNGQRELVALLAGELPPSQGTLHVGTVSVVREDRHDEGLVLDASVRDNVMLGELGRFSRWGLLDLDALETEATRRLASSGAPCNLDRLVRELSGGNQQKLCVERALRREASLIVAAQPTRGVDLGARSDIHEKLREAARAGAGVLVISADLDELRSLASRIVVLVRGRVMAELPPSVTDDELGRVMLGLGATGKKSSA